VHLLKLTYQTTYQACRSFVNGAWLVLLVGPSLLMQLVEYVSDQRLPDFLL
jgi:hypothetical protein